MEFAIIGGLALLGYIYKESGNQHADVEIDPEEDRISGSNDGPNGNSLMGWTRRQGSTLRETFRDDDVPLLMTDDSLATKFYTQRTVTTFSDDYKQGKLDLYTGNSQSMFTKPQRSEKEALFKPIESATLISFSGKPTTAASTDTERYWVNPNASFTQPTGASTVRDLPMGYAAHVLPKNPSARQPKVLPHPLNGHAMVPFSTGPDEGGSNTDAIRQKKEMSAPFAAPPSLASGASHTTTDATHTRNKNVPEPQEYYGAASSASQGEVQRARPTGHTKATSSCDDTNGYFGIQHVPRNSNNQARMHANEVSSSRVAGTHAEFLPQAIAKGGPSRQSGMPCDVRRAGDVSTLDRVSGDILIQPSKSTNNIRPDANASRPVNTNHASSRVAKSSSSYAQQEKLMPTRVMFNPGTNRDAFQVMGASEPLRHSRKSATQANTTDMAYYSAKFGHGGMMNAAWDPEPESGAARRGAMGHEIGTQGQGNARPEEMTLYSAKFGHGGLVDNLDTSYATGSRERTAAPSTLQHVFAPSTQRTVASSDYRLYAPDASVEPATRAYSSTQQTEPALGQARALHMGEYRLGGPNLVNQKSSLLDHVQDVASAQKKLMELMPDNRPLVITLPNRDGPMVDDRRASRQNMHVDFTQGDKQPLAMTESFIGVNLGSKPPVQQANLHVSEKRGQVPEVKVLSDPSLLGINVLSGTAAQTARNVLSVSKRDSGRPDAPSSLGGNSIIPASTSHSSTMGPQRAEQEMPQMTVVGRIQGAPGDLAGVSSEETRFRQHTNNVQDPRGMKVQAPQFTIQPSEDLPRTKISNAAHNVFADGIITNSRFTTGSHINSEMTKVPDKDSQSQLPYGHAHTSLTNAPIVTDDIVNNTRIPDKPLASSTPGPQVNNHAAGPSALAPPPIVVETYKTSHDTSVVGSHSAYYNPMAPPALPFKLTRGKKIEEIAVAVHDADPSEHPLQTASSKLANH